MPAPKLNQPLAAKLAEALKELPIKLACARVGVDERTYREWRQRAEAGELPYAPLIGLCEQARADRAAELLGNVTRAASRKGNGRGDWRAAAWALERLYPDQFGPRQAEAEQPEVPHKVTVRRHGKASEGGGDAPA